MDDRKLERQVRVGIERRHSGPREDHLDRMRPRGQELRPARGHRRGQRRPVLLQVDRQGAVSAATLQVHIANRDEANAQAVGPSHAYRYDAAPQRLFPVKIPRVSAN